jgi:hypothetical protein
MEIGRETNREIIVEPLIEPIKLPERDKPDPGVTDKPVIMPQKEPVKVGH